MLRLDIFYVEFIILFFCSRARSRSSCYPSRQQHGLLLTLVLKFSTIMLSIINNIARASRRTHSNDIVWTLLKWNIRSNSVPHQPKSCRCRRGNRWRCYPQRWSQHAWRGHEGREPLACRHSTGRPRRSRQWLLTIRKWKDCGVLCAIARNEQRRLQIYPPLFANFLIFIHLCKQRNAGFICSSPAKIRIISLRAQKSGRNSSTAGKISASADCLPWKTLNLWQRYSVTVPKTGIMKVKN